MLYKLNIVKFRFQLPLRCVGPTLNTVFASIFSIHI